MDIRVIDSLTVSCNLGSMVLVADGMAKEGASADEIEAKIREMIPRGRIYFVVDTLEYLAKGGRIGGAKKLLAELLEIKPILTVREGQVEPFEQQRTKKRAMARLAEVVAEGCPGQAEQRKGTLAGNDPLVRAAMCILALQPDQEPDRDCGAKP